MADIFLSYARSDYERVQVLVEAFEREGWEVWWDQHLHKGDDFSEIIERAIGDSRTMVVVWSRESIRSRWVCGEAREGAENGRGLLPVLLDDVKPPIGFRGYQETDLTDWDGLPTHPEFQALASALRRQLGDSEDRSVDATAVPQASRRALPRTIEPETVERLLGIPVLGVVPHLRPVDDNPDAYATPGIVDDPLDPAADVYRRIRMNLMSMNTDAEPIRTLVVASPEPAAGTSTTAVNLALIFTQQGHRVLLVDANLRAPCLHKTLHILQKPGLTNLVAGEAEVREVVRPDALPYLDFLPAGSFPLNPSELVGSRATSRILEEFAGRYSYVVIDAPSMMDFTDALVLGASADGVILVLRCEQTTERSAARCLDELRRLRVRTFGAVINDAGPMSRLWRGGPALRDWFVRTTRGWRKP